MQNRFNRGAMRKIRHERLRKRIHGSIERPRLSVFKSNRHTSAQLINDDEGKTLLAVASYSPDLRDELAGKKKVEQAMIIGKLIGERAVAAGIKSAVLDRGGSKFHGRVKELCEAARKAGLEI
ncbi:50S ribosomal protein L18 [bacterium]|nr:50S ribosomal protein L18 [bacterium]